MFFSNSTKIIGTAMVINPLAFGVYSGYKLDHYQQTALQEREIIRSLTRKPVHEPLSDQDIDSMIGEALKDSVTFAWDSTIGKSRKTYKNRVIFMRMKEYPNEHIYFPRYMIRKVKDPYSRKVYHLYSQEEHGICRFWIREVKYYNQQFLINSFKDTLNIVKLQSQKCVDIQGAIFN